MLILLTFWLLVIAATPRMMPLVRQALGSGCTSPSSNNNSLAGLGNCGNYEYYIQMGFGSPPQYFSLQVDTGSFVLWVPTNQTKAGGFVPTASNTLQYTGQRDTLQYADNSGASGEFATDFITLMDTPISTRGQVLVVNQEENMSFNGPVIGIVGMGYSSTPNFLDLAYEAGQIATNTFALQLQVTTNSSFMYYNDIPDYIQKGSYYSSVVGSQFYGLQVIGMYVGSSDLTSYSASTAVIDSGTSLFYLNPGLYNQIVSSYLGGCTSTASFFLCQCNQISMPTLTFMFPGVQVEIPASAYVTNVVGGLCEVYILTLADQSTELLLGDTLFRNYIITFNKNAATVGFYGGSAKNVPVIGSEQWFGAAVWAMMGIDLFLLLWAGYLGFLFRPLARGTQSSLAANSDDIYTDKQRQMVAYPR